MQVEFGEHRYLFVNPRYKGQYLSPGRFHKATSMDQLWGRQALATAGRPREKAIGRGRFQTRSMMANTNLPLSLESNPCTLRLEGPADPSTGLQYSREISIGNDSPRISFHAVMKNATDHAIRWSMQSVTQYDTADSATPADYNHDFWAFAPLNPQSAYTDGYRVRNGLADDPSYAVHDGMFTLHWLYLENEVWLDSDAGWLAIVDDSTKYGMIERFQYSAEQEYPGKSVLNLLQERR